MEYYDEIKIRLPGQQPFFLLILFSIINGASSLSDDNHRQPDEWLLNGGQRYVGAEFESFDESADSLLECRGRLKPQHL